MNEKKLSSKPENTYQDIISKDITGAPKFLEPAANVTTGVEGIDADRYWTQEFYDLENEFLWSRVWQMACQIVDIPNEGDCFHYEIADKSFIIVNTANGIKAYYNACLHRGRKLITGHCRKSEFECPFHAITWSLDGKIVRNPIAWDMPQWNEENSRLPSVKVSIWAGFIFINMDDNAPDFHSLAHPMIKDLEPFDWDNRYREFWFEKHVKANWKTLAEPFMESHHSQTTHPQLVPAIGDINSQYDFPNAYISRQISAGATASPAMEPQPSEKEKLELMKKRGDARVEGVALEELPDEFRARTFLGKHARKRLNETTGKDYSEAKDSELLDYILYGIFPHMTFWAGYGPKLVYRWRPEPGNPEGSIMDIIMMSPIPLGKERPEPARKVILGYNDKVSSCEQGPSSLKIVLDQDFGNIPHIQTGMKSLKSGKINFSEYTESRIRYMHQFIDQFIETGRAKKSIPNAELEH